MSTENTTVGKRIKFMREKRGYSRSKLARTANMTARYLLAVENDEKGLSAIKLYMIAKALRTSMDYLMEGVSRRDYDVEALKILLSFNDSEILAAIKLLRALKEEKLSRDEM